MQVRVDDSVPVSSIRSAPCMAGREPVPALCPPQAVSCVCEHRTYGSWAHCGQVHQCACVSPCKPHHLLATGFVIGVVLRQEGYQSKATMSRSVVRCRRCTMTIQDFAAQSQMLLKCMGNGVTMWRWAAPTPAQISTNTYTQQNTPDRHGCQGACRVTGTHSAGSTCRSTNCVAPITQSQLQRYSSSSHSCKSKHP